MKEATLNMTPLFQKEFLVAQFGSDEAAQAVLGVYLEEEKKLVDPLHTALEEGFDPKELDESSHKIKGSLDLIGAKGLSKLAADICDYCRAGQTEEAKKALTTLCQGLDQLRIEVSEFVA